MIGLDSNVLLRYITGDDAKWSAPATVFINRELGPEQTGYINPIVLAEVMWVLRRRPEFSREKIALLVEEILAADTFTVAHEAAVIRALDLFRNSKAGFTDCLIAELNAEAGATPTYAIDKDAIKGGVFAQLPQDRS